MQGKVYHRVGTIKNGSKMNRFLLCFIIPWIGFIIIPYGIAMSVVRDAVMSATVIMDVGAFIAFPISSFILWMATRPKAKSIIEQ